MANRYVLEVPEEAKGCWAVLRRRLPQQRWSVSRVLPAGSLETEATNAYHSSVRRVKSGEVALVDPRGQETDYRAIRA